MRCGPFAPPRIPDLSRSIRPVQVIRVAEKLPFKNRESGRLAGDLTPETPDGEPSRSSPTARLELRRAPKPLIMREPPCGGLPPNPRHEHHRPSGARPFSPHSDT